MLSYNLISTVNRLQAGQPWNCGLSPSKGKISSSAPKYLCQLRGSLNLLFRGCWGLFSWGIKLPLHDTIHPDLVQRLRVNKVTFLHAFTTGAPTTPITTTNVLLILILLVVVELLLFVVTNITVTFHYIFSLSPEWHIMV